MSKRIQIRLAIKKGLETPDLNTPITIAYGIFGTKVKTQCIIIYIILFLTTTNVVTKSDRWFFLSGLH